MDTPALKTPLVVLATAVLLTGSLAAQERDLTFSTEYPHTDIANFYFQGRAIGSGSATFEKMVEEIEKLPEGSSVVWGPDYGKCPSCGPSPRCVPKKLYPDLWTRLEDAVESRKLRLRGVYPAPPMRSRNRTEDEFPPVISEAEVTYKRYDAELVWEIANHVPGEDASYQVQADYNGRSHAFSASGKELVDYQREFFFGKLPKKSRVLVRLTQEKALAKDSSPASLNETVRCAREKWTTEFSDAVRLGELRVTVAVEPALLREFALAEAKKPARIAWTNFRGGNTPHDEVLYRWNDSYVGRGDKGVDAILERLRELPIGSTVEMQRYEYAGRIFYDNHGIDKIEAENVKLRSVFPFASRRTEFGDLIRERQLKIDWRHQTPHSLTPTTVWDWDGGDRYGQTFASTGRIIFHDETPTPAAATLSWSKYDASVKHGREIEYKAVYTLDGEEIGAGVDGFAKILQRLEALPTGSVVHVAVCLETESKFLCPITYQGLRHFERTGFEPYFGLFPWLVDVCEKRGLKIEWIPDEGASCRDCIVAL